MDLKLAVAQGPQGGGVSKDAWSLAFAVGCLGAFILLVLLAAVLR